MAYDKFTPLKDPSGNDLKYGLIDDSQTLSVGEVLVPAVHDDAAVVNTGGGTTGDLLGVTHSIVGKAGKVLEVDSYAAENDNATSDMVQVTYLPLYIDREYGATLDADNETTDNSSAYGNFAVDSTGLLLDESSYVAYTTLADKQFFSFGLVPGTDRDVTGVFFAKIGAGNAS